MTTRDNDACAIIGRYLWTDLEEISDSPEVLEGKGTWITLIPYEGKSVFAKFKKQFGLPLLDEVITKSEWPGVNGEWTSSVSRSRYMEDVKNIRDEIRDGNVYQVNLCRVLSADLLTTDLSGLAEKLRRDHKTSFNSFLQIPEMGISVVASTPETFLSRRKNKIITKPIKGTCEPGKDFLPKDKAENTMIVDLMRNDFGRICDYGSIGASPLFERIEHPGISHLVSTVKGTLRENTNWKEILDATFPPGSVTGAPKIAAQKVIDELEPVSRGPYCGAIGIINNESQLAQLALTIRTFWRDGDQLKFGTGAGITYDSDPEGEWLETELKAKTLIQLASNVCTPERPAIRRTGDSSLAF